MSQATLSGLPYVNSDLFSSHYLDERLRERDEWDCDEEAQAAMEDLRELYELESSIVEGYREDALVDNWIDEVLDLLGFGTQDEVTLPNGGGFVDELLFETPGDRREAARVYLDTDEETDLFERGMGLVEAKRWDADFTERFSEQRPYRNASHQIKHYLEKTPENIQWGVLTNGRKWRLYGTKDYETQTFYEVDLPELLEGDDVEAFKYFYVFFRPAVFRESGGTTFLDTVRSESETAAQELGENLQDNVFRALRVLGRGFVETNDLSIDPDDDEALDELKEQSLVLLYRLMFVLYAEARGLIHPESPSAQREYEENFSLDELRLEIHDEIGEVDESFDEAFSEYSTTMWGRLADLFRLVDEGEADLGIPPYNGGLFDHEDHDFLTEHEVSNCHLAEVIYRLSTTESDGGRYVLADYADLDTRHLGSVYEGLLEHQFEIAPAEYAAVAEGGGQVWKPATEVTVAEAVETVPEGGLYVVNDEGERKATGAYYTPDYVVTYIVEETVGPLVDEIRDDLTAQGFERGTQEYLGAFLRRVTGLRMLDPAMGSGHFLTTATSYLAERVMAEVREVETDVGAIFDEELVRREIAKECIYGVDLNGMAVELAKLSMWLETLAADRPLAFLDHHLKEGNSLVGSDIEAIEELESDATDDGDQASLAAFGATREGTIERLMEVYADFLTIENQNIDDVRAMKRTYAEIEEDELRRRLVAMSNVHTAERFDLDLPSGAYERMARALEDDDEWAAVSETDWFRSAQALAEEQDFFHWKLEFPEAFYDADGSAKAQAGFDAVIGNPPYVRMEQIKPLKPFLSESYEVHDERVDLYGYFVERSLDLTTGRYGAIVSNKWMRSEYGENLRELLAGMQIEEILDFGDLEVFPGVSTYPCILLVSPETSPSYETTVVQFDDLSFSNLQTVVEKSGYGLPPESLGERKWSLGTVAEEELLQSMDGRNPSLSEHPLVADSAIEDGIGWGIKTGGNDAFVIDDSTRDELIRRCEGSRKIIKILIKGSDVSRYRIADRERYLIYTHHGIDIDAYPAIGEHLREYRDHVGSTATDEEWYELQQPQEEYREFFENPKIVYPDIAKECSFAMDTTGRYPANTCYFIPSGSYALLAVLNSSSVNWYYQYITSEYRGGYKRSFTHAIRDIPIPTALTGSEYADELTEHAERITDLVQRRADLNHSLLDYIRPYSDEWTLTEICRYDPPSGVGDTHLAATTEEYDGLRVGTATCEREAETTVTVHATARYKPDDPDAHETDRWGYTETAPTGALRLTDLTETEADLVESFVPVAVEEGDGFAGFRDNATRTISPLDRLEAITLPDPGDVAADLEHYRAAVERAEELDRKIERTDELIDEIVYELYGLTDEEIAIVEEAADD
jgi:type I restriction-modification system DNA methylase subunit